MLTVEARAARAGDEAPQLFGREADCLAVDDLLEGAVSGTGGALLLWGEPGIGKTALLQYARARAGTMRILSACGIESESEVPFAGLSEILRPILHHLSGLPERQASALAGALAIGPATGSDPFAIGSATLGLLATAAATETLLVIVDDLQWLDASSTSALLFAARRLHQERLAVLLAMRDGSRPEPTALGIPSRLLGGLDRAASRSLLERQAAGPLAPEIVDRLVAETHGNPLALIEISEVLTHELRAGGSSLHDEPLPLGERMRRAFADRVAALPRRTQTSLLLIAANDGVDVAPALRALAALGLGPTDLEAAEATGLVAGDGPRVAFRHPLMRAAVYHAADPAVRRQAHRALAAALPGDREDLAARRAWHLAAATLGEDDALASVLEEVAVSARHRSGYPAAARTYERAGRLSSSPESRARRFLAAAQAWQLANQPAHAMDLLVEAERLTLDRLLLADIQHARALVDTWRGPALEASRGLRAAAESLRDVSPGRAATMLSDATLASITGGDLDAALETAERAHEIAVPLGGSMAVTAALQLGKARILTADVKGGYPLLMEAVKQLAASEPEEHGAELVQAAPVLQTVEEYEVEGEILGQLIAVERAGSAFGQLAYSLGALCELQIRTGQWVMAAANGDEAVQLAREAGQSGQLSYNLARLARLDAAQGRDGPCRSRVAEALVLAQRTNFGSTLPFAHAALGLLALGLGRLPEAVLALEETGRQAQGIGLREPGRLEWQQDLAEALIRAGDRDRADRILDDLERAAQACVIDVGDVAPGHATTGCTLARAAAARCRGLLAEASEIDERFAAAFGWHRWTKTPFELARTELCYGEQLRRHGRRSDARPRLRAALSTFERLGAEPWSQRALAELAATGETVAPRRASPAADLTPQELQVALLVGGGATNREAAATLFLTPKTIEFHLAKVYRKLDLRSRTELATWLARHSIEEPGT